MSTWEIDFASRPLVDADGKRVWELLVCNPDRALRSVVRCIQKEATRAFVIAHLEEVMTAWEEQPDQVRLMRTSAFVEQACLQMGIPSRVSLRTFALRQWVTTREKTVYPQETGYQNTTVLNPTMIGTALQPAPDALLAERWAFVSVPQAEFTDLTVPDFGDIFPVTLATDGVVPGLVLFSRRALPLAAWMQGVEPTALYYVGGERPGLVLEVGAGDRWLMARFSAKYSGLDREGELFEQQKIGSKGFHFLAIQSTEENTEPIGVWTLWSPV
jgi:RNA-binding protein Tab2/Atab2